MSNRVKLRTSKRIEETAAVTSVVLSSATIAAIKNVQDELFDRGTSMPPVGWVIEEAIKERFPLAWRAVAERR